MNNVKKTLVITLSMTLTLSFISTNDAWAFNDYHVSQWEIADKQIINLEKDIANLGKQINMLEEKLTNLETKDIEKKIEKKIIRIQDKIDRKLSQINFLESEINRLEHLHISSFIVDSETESKLISSFETIHNKYKTHVGFDSVLIDLQDEEIVIFIHPNSGLTIDKFEEDVDYEVSIVVNEGNHGSISCNSRDGTCRNSLYGGVEIKRNGDSGGPGTLGYYATHNNGARGFITAGHIADWNGSIINQPENGRSIGIVTEYCGQAKSSCDGAFVDLDDNESGSNRIYKSNNSYYNVIGKTSDSSQTLGTFVKKSGISTGVTYGPIVGNIASANYNTIKFNSNNWISGGDSGSPVFKQPSTRSNNVFLYGLLVSAAGNGQYGQYHPQDFLASELDLR